MKGRTFERKVHISLQTIEEIFNKVVFDKEMMTAKISCNCTKDRNNMDFILFDSHILRNN